MDNGRSIMILSIIVILVLSVSVMGATLSRDMPSRVDPGSEFTAKLIVSDAVAGETLTIEETLPKEVKLKTWQVDGVKETKSMLTTGDKYRVKDGAYGWSVTPTGPVTITYTASAPTTEGNLGFDAIWFDKSGFNHNVFTLSVAPAPEPAAPQPAPVPAPAPTPPPDSAPTVQTPPAPEPATNMNWVWGLAILVLIAVVWYYYSNQQNPKKK